MRYAWLFITGTLFFFACGETRLYEKNYDFEKGQWLVTDQPSFDFTIQDSTKGYNLYCNFRNSLTYPFTRIFITYTLTDSTGDELEKKMITKDLFDRKTGNPHGSSAMGDLYDQQFLVLKDYKFGATGKYRMKFEQFMRRDTLQGILAIGLRVETNEKK